MCCQSSASCEYGISSGPISARSAMTAMTPAETTAARSRAIRPSAPAHNPPAIRTPAPSVMSHAWIQPAVEQIRHEIAEERDDAVHDDHPHHERVVAIDRAL